MLKWVTSLRHQVQEGQVEWSAPNSPCTPGHDTAEECLAPSTRRRGILRSVFSTPFFTPVVQTIASRDAASPVPSTSPQEDDHTEFRTPEQSMKKFSLQRVPFCNTYDLLPLLVLLVLYCFILLQNIFKIFNCIFTGDSDVPTAF